MTPDDQLTVTARPAVPTASGRRLGNLALALAAGSVVCCIVVVPVHSWLATQADINPLFVSDLVVATVWPIVGALIVRSRQGNLVGWLLLIPALIGPYLLLTHYGVASALVTDRPLPGATVATWIGVWGFAPYFFSVPLLALFFPDGRLLSPRWRWVVAVLVGLAGVTTVAAMLIPRELDAAEQVQNPFGVSSAPWLGYVTLAGSSILLLGGIVLGFASVLLRMRRAAGVARAQLQWLVLGVLVLVMGAIAQQLGVEIGFVVALLGPPVAIGIAMFRHRLFDVELVLNRTIVYGLLSALVVGVYAIVVFGVQLVAAGSPLAVLLVAGVALLAAAGRQVLQRAVDRVLFGHRHDPYAVVASVGRHTAAAAEPVDALQRLVEALREALKVPYVAFSGDVSVVSGAPVAGWRVVPAIALGRQVGELHIGLRRAGERASAEEYAAAVDVAARAGTLAYAAGLVSEVARSRERIVLAREEERRRLRADLHDGVGPALAGSAHQLAALARRLDTAAQPELAGRARDLRDRMRQTVADIRSVVHGLRPPVLDQLGLPGALRALGLGYDTPGCTVAVDELGELPAAVEVAAYAIAAEAVANAVRHSAAARMSIRASWRDRAVMLEVADDGCGMPERPRPGVGLRSMGERAGEVGGRLEITTPTGGGTLIRAVLPT